MQEGEGVWKVLSGEGSAAGEDVPMKDLNQGWLKGGTLLLSLFYFCTHWYLLLRTLQEGNDGNEVRAPKPRAISCVFVG